MWAYRTSPGSLNKKNLKLKFFNILSKVFMKNLCREGEAHTT